MSQGSVVAGVPSKKNWWNNMRVNRGKKELNTLRKRNNHWGIKSQ
jgi:hypothetical protein